MLNPGEINYANISEHKENNNNEQEGKKSKNENNGK